MPNEMSNKMSKRLTVYLLDWDKSHKYLKECLLSLQNQTFKDYEIVINDDDEMPFERWNKCLDRVESEYIALGIGIDDVALPNWLEDSVKFLDSNKNISFVTSLSYEIDSNGNRLPDVVNPPEHLFNKSIGFKELFLNMLKYGNFLRFPSCIFRTSDIKTTRFTIDNELNSAADTFFYFDLLSKGHKMAILPKRLIKVRNHSFQYSQSQREFGHIDHITAINKASYLDPTIRTWDVHILLNRLVEDDNMRILENNFRKKEKEVTETGIVIVHEPPSAAGTGVLAHQFVKDLNNQYPNRIYYYLCPDLSESGNIIQNRFYDGVLVLTCKPELLKTTIERYKPIDIRIMHRNVWLDNANFLFEGEYKDKITQYLHDSTWFCKRYHLINHKNMICNGPNPYKCNECTDIGTREIERDLYDATKVLSKVKLVANSQWTKEQYERILGIENIEVKQWELPPIESRFRGKKIGYFGSNATVKGVGILLEAARRLPEYQFILFTDFPKEVLKNQHIIGIDNTLVLGSYKREDLGRLVNLIDIAVVPSLMESYGLVSRELKSLSIPTICTKTGGQDGDVKPNDIDALVNRIIEVEEMENKIYLEEFYKKILMEGIEENVAERLIEGFMGRK